MKPALVFALGALGILAFSGYRKSASRSQSVEAAAPKIRKSRARLIRSKHRNQEGLLDLNSASISELKMLSGIDDDFAERILENRPYLSKLDLVGRRIIPDAAYDAIKHSIIAVHAA